MRQNVQVGASVGDRTIVMMRLIWVTFVVSVVIYGFVVYTVMQDRDSALLNAGNGELFNIVIFMGTTFFILAHVLPYVLFKNTRGLSTSESLSAGGRPKFDIQKYFTPFIIRLTLADMIAIAGFAIAFIDQDINKYTYFALPTFYIFLRSYPTESSLKRMMEKISL